MEVVEIVKGQLVLTAASACKAVEVEDWATVQAGVETLDEQAKLFAGGRPQAALALRQAPGTAQTPVS